MHVKYTAKRILLKYLYKDIERDRTREYRYMYRRYLEIEPIIRIAELCEFLFAHD